MNLFAARFSRRAALALPILLAACGASPQRAGPSLLLSGTAAIGTGISSARVEATCRQGSANTVSGPTGQYTLEILGGAAPCAVRVTMYDGSHLHSVVGAAGNAPVTANITPLTELVTSRLAGGSTGYFYAKFDDAAQAKVTAANLAQARGAVVDALGGVVDLSGVDPISDPLVASNLGSGGNDHDRKIDDLETRLSESQRSLDELASAMVVDPLTARARVATLLAPSTPSCRWLHTGDLLRLPAHGHEAPRPVHVDAQALTLTDNGRVATLAPGSSGTCEFRDGARQYVVAASGLILQRDAGAGAGAAQLALLVPTQPHDPATLAGDWNFVRQAPMQAGGATVPQTGSFTIDADGAIVAGRSCDLMNLCAPWPEGDRGAPTFYVHQAPGGALMLLMPDPQGDGLVFAAPQRKLAAPKVGDAVAYWDFGVGERGTVSPFALGAYKVTAVDPARDAFTRVIASSGRSDDYLLDQPLAGMRRRPAGSSRLADGSTASQPDIVMLPMPGSGLNVYALGSQYGDDGPELGISVMRP